MESNRRDFLMRMLAALSAIHLSGRIGLAAAEQNLDSLVPASLSTAPNYWCTWSAQNYMYGQGAQTLDAGLLEGDSGARLAEQQLSYSSLLGPEGWLHRFYPKLRKELYVVLDAGWEEGNYASFVPDPKKFPELQGPVAEKLKQLNDAVKQSGWRALALWCRNPPGGEKDTQLVEWSEQAGIPYWKIDGGDRDFSVDRARDRLRSSLITEHVFGEGPLNGDWRSDGRFPAQDWDSPRIAILRQADVYRTYDTSTTLSVPTTLDRVGALLKATENRPPVRALLNCEDEVYIAAVLGCTMGIMRHPMKGKRPGGDPDSGFAGPRKSKWRMDEVIRAVRWQRIAPPYAVSPGFVHLDEEILTDEWRFEKGETWFHESIGVLARQGAPARIARNTSLPEVEPAAEKPFVIAGRFPNGTAAIATLERTSRAKGWYCPPVSIRWNVSDATGPFGIFGSFVDLTLIFDQPLEKLQVLAQDLAADRPQDITSSVRIKGKELSISGQLIRRIGLEAGTPGDLSDPALVLAVQRRL